MRIIAGKFKGRDLSYRWRKGLRMTAQNVKESMFAILADKVEDAKILDLFCGLGTLGIEAISRGAKHVSFVDIDGRNLKQIKYFLELLEVPESGETIKRDAIKAIKHFPEDSFDLIIMDPPYHINIEEKAIDTIEKAKILKEQGLCVVEHYSKNRLPDRIGHFHKINEKNYGDSSISIFLNDPAFNTTTERSTELNEE